MINSSYRFTLFITILFIPYLLGCNVNDNLLLEKGVSKELAIHRKNTLSDIKYTLSFDIPKDKEEPIVSKMTLFFTFKNEIVDLILDYKSASDNILKVNVNGKRVDYALKNEHLIIESEFLNPENEVSIDFIAGETALNRNENYLYSLFTPDRASTCFPLFDQPDLKANFNLTLKIPEYWVALSNSAVAETSKSQGYSTVIFNETQLISSYLFAFTAGHFDVEEIGSATRKIKLYHLKKEADVVKANITEIARVQKNALKWLENYTEIQYPFEKFDIVAIPSLPFDGMEHPGAVYYKESSLFLRDSSSLTQKMDRSNLIAHETAHMWFGNLVTMIWFDDIWVKEVFASHLASKFMFSEYPDVNHDLRFLMKNYAMAYETDRTKGAHAIRQESNNSNYANSLYDNIVYHKSPIVIRMLEKKTGEEIFRKSLNKYLKQYSYSNSDWEDFINIMTSNTTEEVSKWEDSWLNSHGMPTIRYSMKEKDSVLIKFRILSEIGENKSLSSQDLVIGMEQNNEFEAFNVEIIENNQKVAFDTSLSSPQYLFTNYGGFGYGYFKMGPASTDYFLKNIGQIESSILRGSLWLNLYEALVRGDLQVEKWMESVLKAVVKEKEPVILEYLNKKMVVVFWKFLTIEQRKAIGSKMEGVLFNMALNSSSDELRSSFFKTFYKIVTTANGIDLMTHLWDQNVVNENLVLSEDDYITLAYELAIRKSDSANLIMHKQLSYVNQKSKRDRVKWVMRALDSDVMVRDQFFEHLKQAENRVNEEWVIEALQYLHHPLRQEASLKYITRSLELVEEIQATGSVFFVENWLDATLSGHQSEEASDLVLQHLYRNNKYPVDLKRKILHSADLLFRTNEMMLRSEK